MFKIGDLCPLFFYTRDYIFENSLTYRQKFHTSDSILVEVISTEEVPTMKAHDLISNTNKSVPFSRYDVNDSIRVYYAYLSLSDSVYEVVITVGGETVISREFEVCSDSMILGSTSLIEYSNTSNGSSFDELFWAGDVELVHQLRVECGFKSSGFQPKTSMETFRTQEQSCRILYAMPYLVETLTIGTSMGVPVWYADLFNRIFCLDKISINGEHIVRSESSDISKIQTLEGSQQYILTVDVERACEMSGIGGLRQQGTAPGPIGVGIRLSDDIEDGEVLQYDGSKSAFVNTNHLE